MRVRRSTGSTGRPIRSGWRHVAGLVCALVGMGVGSSGIAWASPVSPSTTACTYTDGTQSSSAALSGVKPGDSISVSCSSGLGAGETLTIEELSPLALVVSPTSDVADEIDASASVAATASSTGSLTATTFVVPSTFQATDPNAACPPTQAQIDAGLVACEVAVADATSGTVLNRAWLLYSAQGTPASPTLQLSTTSVAGGDKVSVSDAPSPTGYWWGSATQSTSIPASDILVGSTAASSSTVTVSPAVYSVTATSPWTAALTPPRLSGSFVVPSGLAGGSTTLSVFEPNSTPLPGNSTNSAFPSYVEASTTVQVIATSSASLALAPTFGGAGTVVTVTGSSWDPQGGTVKLEFSQNASAPFTEIGSDSVTVAVQGNGTFVTTITVGQSEISGLTGNITAYVAGTQTALDGATISASAVFTLEPITEACVAGSTSCVGNQELNLGIIAGSLTMTDVTSSGNPGPGNVALSSVTLSGSFTTSTGNLNTVQVVDNRGTLTGWSVTGQLESDFENTTPHGQSTDNVIPADFLTWTPSVALATAGTSPSGVLSQVQAGPQATLQNLSGTAVTLCDAPSGGGGGGYDCGAALSLAVPPYDASGTYTAILDLVLLGT
jgi:hypothetical protein